MKKEKERKKNKIIKEVIVGIIPIVLNMLFHYGICNNNIFFTEQISLIFSIFIMYIFVGIITSLVKKTHITTYILSILIFVISVISNIKLNYTNSPIYLSDIYFLKNIFEVSGIVKNDVFTQINYWQLIILFVSLLITCIVSKKASIEIKTTKTKAILGVSTMLLAVLTFMPVQAKDDFLLNTVYGLKERKDYKAITRGFDYYSKYGVLSGMYGLYLEEKVVLPEGYNKEEIKNMIKQAESVSEEDQKLNENKKTNQKPNIILMFQESYWDIENLEEIEFNKDITENMDKLKEKGTYLKMLSPSYGGLSSNVEFELLTGGNLAYFKTGFNPFIQLYSKQSSEKNPSIIKDLKINGYTSKIVFGVDYYLSESVYKRLGVDEYINTCIDKKEEYDEKVKGIYISDKALVDYALDALKNKKEDEKIFYMTCTIQSHMPFYKEKYKNYDIEVTKSSLTEEETGTILSYAQGVYDTNIQIQRLYEEIQNIEEPTIVIVLGDHLPYLYNGKGEDILQKLSYFNTGNEELDLLRKYTTDALILSNYKTKLEFDSEYISPDLLITSIINNLDIQISPFYKWLYQTKDIMPAQNQYLILDKDLNKYSKEDVLPQEIQNIKDIKEKMQYYYFKENK